MAQVAENAKDRVFTVACSWAGRVPGENDSVGKHKSTRCRKGNKTLRRVLAQTAWAASHCKKGYLRACFHRVKSRRGWKKAIVATGHKILTIAFHMLRNNQPYRELGHDYFDRLNPARATRKLIQRLEALGHSGSPFARGVKCVNPAGSAFTGICFLRTPARAG
jgi:hypothetical protein